MDMNMSSIPSNYENADFSCAETLDIQLLRQSANTAHQMPEPSQIPWNAGLMPWANGVQHFSPGGVLEFTGDFSNQSMIKYVSKRKADTDIMSMPIPKRHITDDHMAQHLNSLHISNNFTSHHLQPTNATTLDDLNALSSLMIDPEASTSTADQRNMIVPMSTKDLQRKLRNAQRITICDQLRRIKNEPLLPGALMQRIERPCTALVVWQPPPKALSTILGSGNSMDRDGTQKNNIDSAAQTPRPQDDDSIEDTRDLDNNNSGAIDLNCTMDLDI